MNLLDANRHARRARIGNADGEFLARHPLKLDELDAGRARREGGAHRPIRRALADAVEIQAVRLVRELHVAAHVEPHAIAPEFHVGIHVADGDAHDRADDVAGGRIGRGRNLHRLHDVAVRVTEEDRLGVAERRLHGDRRLRRRDDGQPHLLHAGHHRFDVAHEELHVGRARVGDRRLLSHRASRGVGELGQFEIEAARNRQHRHAQVGFWRVGQHAGPVGHEGPDRTRQAEHLLIEGGGRIEVVGGVNRVHEADEGAAEVGLSLRRRG